MREPHGERETFLADRIDKAGQAILESGAVWEDGILQFSHPYDHLTEREEKFITERIAGWESRISQKPR